MTTAVTATPTGLPAWSRSAAIGDYGGALDKKDSATEGGEPYAFYVYRQLQDARGSAYSQESGTIVHCENLALARTLSAVWFRGPERMRANSVPASSDERLDYWVTALAVPVRSDDQKWQIRERCAAHFRAATGPTTERVREALAELLGDAFVDLYVYTGSDLANPPDYTIWPGVNDGSGDLSLGRGDWLSVRCKLFVEVQQPPGVTISELVNLLDVQLVQLLDRMLPAWADFGYFFSDGFDLDLDHLSLDSL